MAQKTIAEIRAEIEETLAANKAIAAETVERAKLEVELSLAQNVDYLTSQIKVEDKLNVINKLKGKLAALNDLPTIRLPRGERVTVNAFQTGRSFFGEEVSYLIGIAQTLNNLFMDQHILLGYATIGTNIVTIENFQKAFGRTAYYSNKTAEISPQEKGNYSFAKDALQTLARDMNLDVDLSKFSREMYDAYFENEKVKADKRAADIALGVVASSTPNSAGQGRLTLTPGAEA